MAIGTTLSRATGFLRTMALASALGVSATSDAYNTANTAPNMIFALVAGGALSAAVVPMLVRAGEDRVAIASTLLGATVVIGLIASVAVAVAAPWIMRLLTAGARGRPGYDTYLSLGTSWLRMFAPQVAMYALSVMAVAIMTARRHLTLGAVAPVATNVLTIAAVVAYIAVSSGRLAPPADVTDLGRHLLGWGTTVAVASMAAIQLVGARRAEPGLRIRFAPRHPAVRELLRIGGWVSAYVVTNQIGLAVVTAIANSVTGGITAYQWGFMVMQLPYAIVAVSILSAAVPSIAGDARAEVRAGTITRSLRLTLWWLLPAAIGILFVAAPAARLVVGGTDIALVRAAISGFAISLVPFSMFQMLVRTSYALGNSRSPAVVNIAVNAVNVLAAAFAIAIAATPTQRVVGLTLSHASSYVIGCAGLGLILTRRRMVSLPAIGRDIPRLLVAAVPTVMALVALSPWIGSLDGSRRDAVIGIGGAAGIASLVYVFAVRRLRPEVIRQTLASTHGDAQRELVP